MTHAKWSGGKAKKKVYANLQNKVEEEIEEAVVMAANVWRIASLAYRINHKDVCNNWPGFYIWPQSDTF